MLRGYSVRANDGEMGTVHDFYFHDDTWLIRYLVVATGRWLSERRVLITTGALGKPDWEKCALPVGLTQEQVAKSPEVDTDQPVSRQQEEELHNYYGWPFYWIEPATGVWPSFVPLVPVPATAKPAESATKTKADPHLRSTREITGYHIHASDGAFGHIADYIADDVLWVIRYLVIQTGNWLPAKKVLLSPQWLGEIRYAEREVIATLTRERILNCPEFAPGAPVNREYEERLYDYYGRPVYWDGTEAEEKRSGGATGTPVAKSAVGR